MPSSPRYGRDAAGRDQAWGSAARLTPLRVARPLAAAQARARSAALGGCVAPPLAPAQPVSARGLLARAGARGLRGADGEGEGSGRGCHLPFPPRLGCACGTEPSPGRTPPRWPPARCRLSLALRLEGRGRSLLRPRGQDKLFFKDGSYYEGKFVNGEIMGNGFQSSLKICPSKLLQKIISSVSVYSCRVQGNTYSSQFVFGKLHGRKVLQYKDGRKYEGEFLYGMREVSLSSSMLRNEDNYEGAWILDKCQGHGILPCPVGTIYEGQWRNDIFNERGAIVNCSGDICDGLWINGYPAACRCFGRNHGGAGVSVQPMKTTAEQIFTLQPMEAPTPEQVNFPEGTAAHGKPTQEQVLLTGTVACGGAMLEQGKNVRRKEQQRAVNGHGLEIWAGIRNHQIQSSATNLFELIEETERKTVNCCVHLKTYQHKQTKMSKLFSFTGFGCISYLLTYVASGNWELKSTVSVTSNLGFALSDLPIPREIEPESGSDTLCGAGDASSSQHAKRFKKKNHKVLLAMKGGKKPSGRISAEKAEKMTVSQEKMEDSSFSIHILSAIFDQLGNSTERERFTSNEGSDWLSPELRETLYERSHMTSKEYKLQKNQHLIKNSKTLQGHYVLMVHEVTMPPFLGQTLPPAFKLLIFPEKTKNKDSFKVTSK
ncbi:LOW QUALITY PROTEIN: MORN repeat-containing protein 1 [Sarcoramphus papa]